LRLNGINIFFTLLLLITFKVSYAQTKPETNGSEDADADTTESLKPEPDTVDIPNNDALEDVVTYSARDSMRMDLPNQKVYLYGNGHVMYQEIDLKADYIEFSFSSKTVMATYLLDSTGKQTGRPVFTDGKETFTADRIDYNFDSQKGLIRNVRTQVSEGYIDADIVKKDTGNIIFIKDGSFCPCEDPDAATRLRIKRLKIMEELIVTGPGYLEIAGIPTPLAFPFGFFPNKKAQSSGIIIPTYGESPALGFFLQKGGYYWPVNDYFDTQILADIYSRGSWGLHNLSTYKVRYKYSGAFDISYTVLKNGDPDLPGYSRNNTFFIRWNHSQDPKARPGSVFRANVNLGSVDNFQNTFSSTVNDYLSNTFNSSVSWNKTFIGTPFSLAVNARHSQSSTNRQVSVTLPEASFNVNRIYPFARKSQVGAKKAYEQIGFSWRTDASNQVTAPASLYRLDRWDALRGQMRNGFRNTAVINWSLKLFKGKATFNPSVNYVQRVYFNAIEKIFNPATNFAVNDTLSGIFMNHEASMNANFSSKMYGYYMFRGKFIPVKIIRHVLTPQLTFSYRPVMSEARSYTDTLGREIRYSPYETGLYGQPTLANSGLVTLNLINTLDMKVRDKKDTTGTGLKKVNLIENFNILWNYDMFKDSLRFSNITMTGRTNLFKVLNINYSAALDPYNYVNGQKVNQSLVSQTRQLTRLTNGQLATGFMLRSKKKTSPSNRNQNTTQEPNESVAPPSEEAAIRNDPNAFVDFSIPWTMNVNYTLNLSRSFILASDVWVDSLRITQAIMCNGDLNLTEKWKIGYTTGFDIQQKKFTFTTLSVYRDLNCWEMAFDWVPFGGRQSYSISINMKSSLLRDLRLQRRRSWFDTQF